MVPLVQSHSQPPGPVARGFRYHASLELSVIASPPEPDAIANLRPYRTGLLQKGDQALQFIPSSPTLDHVAGHSNAVGDGSL